MTLNFENLATIVNPRVQEFQLETATMELALSYGVRVDLCGPLNLESFFRTFTLLTAGRRVLGAYNVVCICIAYYTLYLEDIDLAFMRALRVIDFSVVTLLPLIYAYKRLRVI